MGIVLLLTLPEGAPLYSFHVSYWGIDSSPLCLALVELSVKVPCPLILKD